MDGQFEDLMKDIDFDEMAFAVPDGRADDDDASMRDDASDKTEYDTYLDDDDDDPMAQLRKPDRTQLGDRHLRPRRVPEAARH